MDITPMSMEAVIMRHARDMEDDPHLKKLFAELQALRSEIKGPKAISKTPDLTVVAPKANVVKKIRAKRRNTTGDSTFRSQAFISATRRKSDRLSGKTPSYKYMDDIDEVENNRLYANGELRKDFKMKPRQVVHRMHVNTTERIILKPEEITEDMLNNICYNSNDKVYDKEHGSSCHQCRQKTSDTKTICRNFDCFGVRGQFCGPCALNRYGVDVAKALLDPFWSCFVCQGVCNCSFCRSRNGKRPTGILAPIAKREGHDSVKEFLDELKLSLTEEDDFDEQMRDSENVFGFSDELNVLTVGGNEKIFNGYKNIMSSLSALIIKDIIADFDSHFVGFSDESLIASENELEKVQNVLKSTNF